MVTYLFGDFIAEKRKERGISLRGMAEKIGFTPPYYSDLEKSRRNPPNMKTLIKIANELGLSDRDRDLMFDYAGRDRRQIAPDLPEYIMDRPAARLALRKARNKKMSDEKWEKIVKIIDEE